MTTVTLEVSPRDAKAILLAQAKVKLSLSLVGFEDIGSKKGEEIDFENIIGKQDARLEWLLFLDSMAGGATKLHHFAYMMRDSRPHNREGFP